MSEKPQRIQLRRAKGWRMPADTVKVDRTTRWGNPFRIGVDGVKDAADAVQLHRVLLAGYLVLSCGPSLEEQRAYRRYVNAQVHRLQGKNLACWCRPGAACHADVLLELAALRATRKAEAA